MFILLDESLDIFIIFVWVLIDIEENVNNKFVFFIGYLCIDDNMVYYVFNDFFYMVVYDILFEKEIKLVFERMYIFLII